MLPRSVAVSRTLRDATGLRLNDRVEPYLAGELAQLSDQPKGVEEGVCRVPHALVRDAVGLGEPHAAGRNSMAAGQLEDACGEARRLGQVLRREKASPLWVTRVKGLVVDGADVHRVEGVRVPGDEVHGRGRGGEELGQGWWGGGSKKGSPDLGEVACDAIDVLRCGVVLLVTPCVCEDGQVPRGRIVDERQGSS
eukprot:1181682-Prorocentrum_minimum.AAC.1